MNVVELLLTKGANINDKDNDGWSSIICASCQGHVNVVKLLLSKGANINDTDNYGNSSIIVAIRNNDIEMVNLLLSKGANIPENIDELLEDSLEGDELLEMKLIFRNWPTTMGLLATEDLYLDIDNKMDLAKYLGTRDPLSGGRKRKKQKSNKNKKNLVKNKRKSIKRRK